MPVLDSGGVCQPKPPLNKDKLEWNEKTINNFSVTKSACLRNLKIR